MWSELGKEAPKEARRGGGSEAEEHVCIQCTVEREEEP